MEDHSSPRLGAAVPTSRIRRLYFYLVAFAGLAMLMAGLVVLLRLLLEHGLTATGQNLLFALWRDADRERLAAGSALVLVGLPVWLIHWHIIQRWLAGVSAFEERATALRRLYLYAALAVTALTAYFAARDTVTSLLRRLLGAAAGTDLPPELADAIPSLIVGALFWGYHWRIAEADRVAVGEAGASATLRRWYVYGLAVFGLVPLLTSLAAVFEELWLALAAALPTGLGSTARAWDVAESVGTVLVAGPFWLFHDWQGRLLFWRTPPGQPQACSVLHAVYLYGLVAGTVGWALFGASQIVDYLLARALGVAPPAPGENPLAALGRPLSFVIVGGLAWALTWRRLRRQAAVEAETRGAAAVRRVYYYLVAGLALAVSASGAAGLLRLVGDLALGGAAIGDADLRRSLATHVGLLVIGVPVWLVHWRSIQARVVSGNVDEIGATTRRVYLYLVALAAIGTLLFNGALVVYNLALVLLGQPPGGALGAAIGRSLANAAVAGLVLWYHWWLVLRADQTAIRAAQVERELIAHVSGLDPTAARVLERYVRESLPGARIEIRSSERQPASSPPAPT